MNARKKYTFIDLFSGCGGLSEGFMASGHFLGLAHVEWELPMVQTLRRRLAQKWGETEIDSNRKVVLFDIQKTDELINGGWSEESLNLYGKNNSTTVINGGLKAIVGNETVDFIIGGPPCQAYSIHGRATDKNSMKDDYRNYLFESFVKVVESFKPKAFIFENVTGMLTAKPGGKHVVDRIYKAFNDIGYQTLHPREFKNAVYDAYDYDVPQHRKRVILIGVRNGESFSIDDFYRVMSSMAIDSHKTVRDVIGNMPPLYPLSQVVKDKGHYISHHCNGDDPHHIPRHCSPRDIEVFRTWIGNNMNNCSQKEAIDFYKQITGKDTLYRKYRNLEWDKPAPTIVAHLQKDGFMFIHPDIKQLRSITVREAALLMTFPIDYQFIGNRSYCYKMIGNAVPVHFAKAIAQSLYLTLN